MSEIVERVTRKLHEMNEFIPLLECERLARAAIEAMREPTEAMVEHAFEGTAFTWARREEIADGWRFMIDEALK